MNRRTTALGSVIARILIPLGASTSILVGSANRLTGTIRLTYVDADYTRLEPSEIFDCLRRLAKDE